MLGSRLHAARRRTRAGETVRRQRLETLFVGSAQQTAHWEGRRMLWRGKNHAQKTPRLSRRQSAEFSSAETKFSKLGKDGMALSSLSWFWGGHREHEGHSCRVEDSSRILFFCSCLFGNQAASNDIASNSSIRTELCS